MRTTVSLIALLLLLPLGAHGAPKSPLVNETRAVESAVDEKKTVTVADGMVWYDASPPTHGIRFPAGTYALEAQDKDYWYFHSPELLELRLFKDGQAVDGRTMTGGIMISKKFLSSVPAAGYIDGENGAKILLWKLGRDFVRMEGKQWKKSF